MAPLTDPHNLADECSRLKASLLREHKVLFFKPLRLDTFDPMSHDLLIASLEGLIETLDDLDLSQPKRPERS